MNIGKGDGSDNTSDGGDEGGAIIVNGRNSGSEALLVSKSIISVLFIRLLME